MSVTYDRDRVRCKLDASQDGVNFADVKTAEAPSINRGTSAQFDLGMFYGEDLIDVSRFASVIVEVKPLNDRTGNPVMQKIIPYSQLTTGMTEEQWDDGTAQHLSAKFTPQETNLDFVDDFERYWLVVTALALGDTDFTVRAATTANITLSGTQTIDGVAVIANDRVLVKNQTLPANNGIYVASAGAWSRATDYNQSAEVQNGQIINATEGTNYGRFILTTQNPIVLGTTELVFEAWEGNIVTLGTTVLTIVEDGHGGELPASVITPTYVTMAQAVSLFVTSFDTSAMQDEIDANTSGVAANTSAITGKLSKTTDTFTGVLTVSGSIVASNISSCAFAGTVTVTTGGLTVTAGGITVTAGGLVVTAGGLTVTAGGMTVTAGALTVNPSDQTTSSHVATRGYVATSVAAYVPLAGGTMTGHLIFTDNLYDIGATGATRPRRVYVSTEVVSPSFTGDLTGNVTGSASLNLLKSGGTMTGALLFTHNTIDIGASGATKPRTGYFGTSVVAPLFVGALTGAASSNVLKAGDAMTGLLYFSGTTHAGIRLNNLTSSERNAIAIPAAGMLIWNTSTEAVEVYNGTTWAAV